MTSVARSWLLGPLSLLRGNPLDPCRPGGGRVSAPAKHQQEQQAHRSSSRVEYDTRFFDVVQDAYEPQGGLAAASEDGQAFPVSCETCAGSSDCLNFMDARQVRVAWGFRPLLVGSTLLGLTHTRRRGTWYGSPSRVYSLVACLILWANFIRFFANYKDDKHFGTKLFMKITMHVWYGQVAATTTVFSCHITPRLPHFFKVWDRYNRQHQCSTAHHLRGRVMRHLLMVCAFILGLLTCSILVIIFESPYVESPASQFLLNTHNTESLELTHMRLLQGVFTVFSTYAGIIWIWPTAMLVAVCSGLKYNYKRISLHIAKNFKTMDVTALEKTRRRHQSLCRIVKQADELFSFYNLLMYLTAVPLICFAIYNFAFQTSDDATTMGMVMSIVHMLSLSAQIGIMTAAGSSLCRQAIAPKEELLDVHFEVESEMCHQKGIQIMIFLHRLSHSHIGLTAWNLFNITRTTIMTVVTMILSNVFVLIKFGLTLEPIANGNCTDTGH